MKYIYQNKQINYHISGSGNTLVFLHGFTESLEIWKDFSRELETTNTILTIDLPGHGQSEALENSHNMEEVALIVKSVLDFNAISQCVMIGHSMGGYVALAFAEAYPEYLKGLCLFHSSALGDTAEIKQNRDKTIEIVKKNKFGYLNAFIPDLFAPENRNTYQEEIKTLIKNSEFMTADGIIKSIIGMKDRKTRVEVLKNIKMPVLFIAGKKDSRVPLDKINQQIILPQHAESLILENVGHMGYIEAKEQTMKTILFFAKKIFE